MSYEFMKYDIDNDEFTFINDYWQTSRAWGHSTRLFKNGNEIATNRVRYYNRTWEYFRYQTCMIGAINNEMEYVLQNALNNYKDEHNITRFRKGEKAKVIADIEEHNAYYRQLKTLLEKVRCKQ